MFSITIGIFPIGKNCSPTQSDENILKMNLDAATETLPPANANSNVAIRVNGVSKCYAIYDHPRDRLLETIRNGLHAIARPLFHEWVPQAYHRDFWALRDISFSIPCGEAVGVVGRNGAGKSTLLQIIAGTLTPTSGNVEIRGKVAALLELGSGFNPEFTGRENVYLNASLWGLSQEETDAKFVEIVAFADIGSFIDQPVKIYSSGMLVRLAFAVQTAVKPQILIVDEALAVGDMFFQAKCMERLRRLMKDGVTILFVSHDIGTVRQLCSRAILLDEGSLLDLGPVQRVTDHYLRLDIEERNRRALTSSNRSNAAREEPHAETPSVLSVSVNNFEKVIGNVAMFRERSSDHRSGDGTAEFINVQILKDEESREMFDYGDVVALRQVVRFHKTLDHVNVSYKIRTVQGIDIVFGDTRLTGDIARRYEEGRVFVFEWNFRLDLMHGNYVVMSSLAHPPFGMRDDWSFVDMIPTSAMFRMAPRKAGMIDGFVVWNNSLAIRAIA